MRTLSSSPNVVTPCGKKHIKDSTTLCYRMADHTKHMGGSEWVGGGGGGGSGCRLKFSYFVGSRLKSDFRSLSVVG